MPTKGTHLGVDPVSGDVVVAGQTTGPVSVAGGPTLEPPGAGMDVFVARLDASYSPIWSRRSGGDGDDQITSVDVDTLGRVLVAGTLGRGAARARARRRVRRHLRSPRAVKVDTSPQGWLHLDSPLSTSSEERLVTWRT